MTHPTPAEVRAARAAAGLTQAQAAALVHLAHPVRWSEYERGAQRMPRARWELFLRLTAAQQGERNERS